MKKAIKKEIAKPIKVQTTIGLNGLELIKFLTKKK